MITMSPIIAERISVTGKVLIQSFFDAGYKLFSTSGISGL